MNNNMTITEESLEKLITNTMAKVLSTKFKEWLTVKEGANYAGVSYNTFMKFHLQLGLKFCLIDGVRRVSRKEIDTFLQSNSY